MPSSKSIAGELSKRELIALDKRHFWHPFTPMKDWTAPGHEPLIIASGKGATLRDIDGNEYLDGNASIWTNIHGHQHPRIDEAIADQLRRLAHCSALGFTSEPAIRLAAALAALFPGNALPRVFFTDDGSTAMECAARMAVQYWQLQGRPERREFLAFTGAYHGDTLGAAALGGIETFRARLGSSGYPVHRAAGIDDVQQLDPTFVRTIAALAIEPLIRGAAGMRLWPPGMLARLREWCDEHDVLLILDEVMTGFGRTGAMFACQREQVIPDFLALAKGLSGGYLPLAATLTTDRIYEAFLGESAEQKTFFYGHSYCGNPLGCAAALASLRIFEEEQTLTQLPPKIDRLRAALENLRQRNPFVPEVRQCGLMAGIDVRPRPESSGRTPSSGDAQTGHRVCLAARAHGLLTRPILDTIVLMPPLCVTLEEIDRAVRAVHLATLDACAPPSPKPA